MRAGRQVSQKGCLSSSGFTGKENMTGGAVNKLDGRCDADSLLQRFFCGVHRVKDKHLDSKIREKKQSDFPDKFESGQLSAIS